MDIKFKQWTLGAALVAVLAALCAGCVSSEPKEPDLVISMNDLPPAVRSLSEKETVGCRIIEVEKEVKTGEVVYAITYDQAGTTMELEYAPDGRLISKGEE